MAVPRYRTVVAGLEKLIKAIATTAGAADADKIVATNASGILAPALLNATVTSAGVGSAAKIPQLDGAGKLDNSVLPTGVGADTYVIVASEALAAGDFVNVWSNAGTANVRKADATATGKQVHGFVLAAVSAAANATIYTKGTNTQLSGMTPGVIQYLATTAGARTATAPSTDGNVVQDLGIAMSATSMDVEIGEPIELVP